jgi:carbamoyltransferase
MSAGPVLGLGGSNHDFSAAIIDEGTIAVAIEDERVQRVKWGRCDWHACPAHDAARYCIEAAGIELGDLAGIFCCDDLERPSEWIDWSQVEFVNHHLAHAAASFFAFPHKRATLLVIDGHGSPVGETTSGYEVETFSLGWAEGSELSLHTLQSGVQKKTSSSWRHVTQNSVGWFYQIVAMAIGLGNRGEGKAMGLAAYGEPRFLDDLRGFIELRAGGQFAFDPYGGIWDWLTETLAAQPHSMQVRADLAFAAQEIFAETVVAVAKEAHRRAPAPVLSFGGGCALNTLANTRILEETEFEEVAVFPASGDNGLAVGAALYGAHARLGQPRRAEAPGWRGRAVYTGREYTSAEIDAALADAPVAISRPKSLAAEAAQALVAGEIVAVCRGRSEIGPRALGNRSLLACPASPRMRDHININIKQRESFRPLAPAVPIEEVDRYFEVVAESPFMLLVARVRDEARNLLGAVTHVDGTARVQTVRREDNPFLHELLRSVGDLAGVPVLLNTSLNLRGEPIVETPADALSLFVQRPIDMLVLDDRVVRKYSPWSSPSLPASLGRSTVA